MQFESKVASVIKDESNMTPESMGRIVALSAVTSLVIAFAEVHDNVRS